jgi:hypothetical protein
MTKFLYEGKLGFDQSAYYSAVGITTERVKHDARNCGMKQSILNGSFSSADGQTGPRRLVLSGYR